MKLEYRFHEPCKSGIFTYVPHQFYLDTTFTSTEDRLQFLAVVSEWCTEQFGDRSATTWMTAGNSFYVFDDNLAFEMKMRWL